MEHVEEPPWKKKTDCARLQVVFASFHQLPGARSRGAWDVGSWCHFWRLLLDRTGLRVESVEWD